METITELEAEKRYNEHLDGFNINQFIQIPTSKMLKELDPTQYDCGLADFCDAKDIEIEDMIC